MAFRDIFRITRQTRILVVILVFLSATGFFIAYLYYNHQNKSDDPRVKYARQKLLEYDRMMATLNYSEALKDLDTVYFIYNGTRGYEGSYEFGVIYNNRGTVYLSMALYDSLIPEEERPALLALAEKNIRESIRIYSSWIDSAGKMNHAGITTVVAEQFRKEDPGFKGKNPQRIIRKRVDEIINAQTETPRRLSVSYTNLGIIQRHQFKQEEAIYSYIEAIKLWKDNFTARNNLNVLMGKPPEDRSILEKLFPPERLK